MKVTKRWAMFGMACMVLLAPVRVRSAMAQGAGAAGSAPSADSLVALALSRSPSLGALRVRAEAARLMVRPAGALPDPRLELMLQDAGFPKWTVGEMDMSMIGPQLSQDLPFPGKRGARRRTAAARADVQAASLQQMEREVAREIRMLYARLYVLDRKRQTLAAGRELAAVLAAATRDRYGAGLAEGEGAIKARIVLARTDEQLDDLATERSTLVASLNRWLDQPGDAPLAAVDSLPVPSPPALPWAAPALEGSRSIAARRAELLAAQQGVAEARLERWPDFMAGAGVGFRGAKDAVVSLRLGLALPLWSGQKQGPMLRAAEREVDAAELSLRAEQAAARAEAARLEAEWRNAEQQLVRYRQTIVPQTSLALEAARSSYLVGRGDFSTVIEDLDLWLEARVGTAQREADRYIAWAGLEALLGTHPTNPGRGE